MTSTDPFEEIERALDTLSEGFGVDVAAVPVDVVDEGDAFLVRADLPGYESEDIEVTLQDQRLAIAAERESDDVASGDSYVTRERRHRSASRTVRLPEPVEEDATASYDRGVLSVRLPKRGVDDGDGTDIPVN